MQSTYLSSALGNRGDGADIGSDVGKALVVWRREKRMPAKPAA